MTEQNESTLGASELSDQLYAKRCPMELDKAGNYYCKHIMAMTAEGLHSKSDIAMELGHRDMLLKMALDALGYVGMQDLYIDYKGVSETKAALRKHLGV